MPAKRTSFNLPEETRNQLLSLAARYGTMTNVVIMAVRDMFEREYAPRKQQARREKGQDDDE